MINKQHNHTIQLTKISFPEIKLHTRDAHKLRGYFGSLFKEHSPLLHNHYDDGQLRYQYPLVQYKVLQGVPTLVGLLEGSELLTKLFLQVRSLQIDGKIFDIHSKNIEQQQVAVGYSDQLHEYRFDTLWMALNQKNHQLYKTLKTADEKSALLNRLLVGQVLSFFKNIDLYLQPEERLMAKVATVEKTTAFKDQKMLVFSGQFVLNALLPNHIGIGKSVSRGFGSIFQVN